jgi:hypothetical protein
LIHTYPHELEEIVMTTIDRPSEFTGDAARRRFLTAYDRTLAELWPVPVDALDVRTRSGSVRVYRAGPAGDDPIVLLGARCTTPPRSRRASRQSRRSGASRWCRTPGTHW